MRHHSAAAACSSGRGPARPSRGGAEQLVGLDAGARHGGQPFGQQRGELVAADLRGQGVEQLAPFLERRGVVAGDAPVESSLVGGGGLLQLRRAGRAPVVDGDLHGRSPDLDVGHRGGVGSDPVLRPGRQRRSAAVARPRTWSASWSTRCARWVEVGTPVRVVGQSLRDAGHPGQRAGAGVAQPGGVQPPVEHRGAVLGRDQFPVARGRPQRLHGVLARGAEQQQMGAQRGPGGLVGQAGEQLCRRCCPGRRRRRGPTTGSRAVLGGDVEAVEVALGGLTEPGGGVGLLAHAGWSRTAGRRRGPASTRGCRWG